MDIVAVNRAKAHVLTDDGDIWPITTWLDGDGDPCDEEDAFLAIVKGPNVWVVVNLDAFEERAMVN